MSHGGVETQMVCLGSSIGQIDLEFVVFSTIDPVHFEVIGYQMPFSQMEPTFLKSGRATATKNIFLRR